MVTTQSTSRPYRTLVSRAQVRIEADAVKDGRGSGERLRPHELLEAALASCMNISARLEAEARGLGPVEVRTVVSIDRTQPGKAITVIAAAWMAPFAPTSERPWRPPRRLAPSARPSCGLPCWRWNRPGGGTLSPVEPKPDLPASAVRWDARDYHLHASAQAGWGRDLHARLPLRGDERLLDLGCGDGQLTSELAERVPRGEVLGIDADPDMVAFARTHHARANLSFSRADVRHFAAVGRFDAIVSNACLHWVAEHEAVLRRCRAHIDPGGTILFQMGEPAELRRDR